MKNGGLSMKYAMSHRMKRSQPKAWLRKCLVAGLLASWLSGGLLPLALPAYSQGLSEDSSAMTSASRTNPLFKGYVRTLDSKYLISPGDHLSVSVFNASEFDHPELTVRPDGYLTLRSVGELKVSGMDVTGLEQAISQKLGRYLKNPEVAVTLTQFHPAIVYVLGAVQKPGAFEIHGETEQPVSSGAVLTRGRLTVSNLIAHAGGVTEDANLTQVIIRNNETGESKTIDLLKMLKDGDISQDLMVHSGDTVQIPKIEGAGQMDDQTYKLLTSSSLAPGNLTVRVLGQVHEPGVYTLNAQTAGVNSAIASAKGYLIEANKQVLKVMRMSPDGHLSSIAVNPFKYDFVLRNNDVVYVDERPGPVGGRAFDYTARAVTPVLALGNTFNSVLDIFYPSRRFRSFRNFFTSSKED